MNQKQNLHCLANQSWTIHYESWTSSVLNNCKKTSVRHTGSDFNLNRIYVLQWNLTMYYNKFQATMSINSCYVLNIILVGILRTLHTLTLYICLSMSLYPWGKNPTNHNQQLYLKSWEGSAGGAGNWRTCSNVLTESKNSCALTLTVRWLTEMQMMYTLRRDWGNPYQEESSK